MPSTFNGMGKVSQSAEYVVPLFSEGALLSLKPKVRISRLRTVAEKVPVFRWISDSYGPHSQKEHSYERQSAPVCARDSWDGQKGAHEPACSSPRQRGIG